MMTSLETSVADFCLQYSQHTTTLGVSFLQQGLPPLLLLQMFPFQNTKKPNQQQHSWVMKVDHVTEQPANHERNCELLHR